jgi:hypothetical protein
MNIFVFNFLTTSSNECLKLSAHIPIESRDLGLVKLSLSKKGKSFKCYTDKNKIKFSSYIRKLRWEQLHSHIEGRAYIYEGFFSFLSV